MYICICIYIYVYIYIYIYTYMIHYNYITIVLLHWYVVCRGLSRVFSGFLEIKILENTVTHAAADLWVQECMRCASK